jgi:hypothetical protein
VAAVEEGGEEGGEEHHLRADEPHHALAEGLVLPAGVVAALVFGDHRAEPAVQHEADHPGAGRHHPRPRRELVHLQDEAQGQQEHAPDRKKG